MALAVALNRFGLGARLGDVAPADPRIWLLDQFDRFDARPAVWAALPASGSIARTYLGNRRIVAATDGDEKVAARMTLQRGNRTLYLDAVDARMAAALDTPAPFAERLVHFWANYFAISTERQTVLPFAGAFEAEAIRPHLLGRFADMLHAVERHPAMILFLDQNRSAGPQSEYARAARTPRGLNENLAREILELHTVGVNGGYRQADVREFARALTGWSIGGFGPGNNRPAMHGLFHFRPALHEPGVRVVMGKSYPQAGEAQANAILDDLALAPATARHVATRLARHFVADEPPAALVDRLATSFLASGGDLPTLYRALVDAPESWAADTAKFKTPWEWLTSALRGTGMRQPGRMRIAAAMQQLGQPVWQPGSPAGYDDVAAGWAAPDALMRRVEMAQRIAGRADPGGDPRRLAALLLPGQLSAATTSEVARAESVASGLALLLVSPEFLRR